MRDAHEEEGSLDLAVKKANGAAKASVKRVREEVSSMSDRSVAFQEEVEAAGSKAHSALVELRSSTEAKVKESLATKQSDELHKLHNAEDRLRTKLSQTQS